MSPDEEKRFGRRIHGSGRGEYIYNKKYFEKSGGSMV